MEIRAKYMKKMKQGQLDRESTLLHSNFVDNELLTLTKVNFIDDKYVPQCRLNNLNNIGYDIFNDHDHDDLKFDLDDLSYSVIYSTITEDDDPSQPSINPEVEVASNLGRSLIISTKLDKDVSSVEFRDDNSTVTYDIDEKYVKYNKLFTLISTGLSDFNLMKSMHETSMHPHESLDKDVVISPSNESSIIKTSDSTRIDIRNNSVLGFNLTNIDILG